MKRLHLVMVATLATLSCALRWFALLWAWLAARAIARDGSMGYGRGPAQTHCHLVEVATDGPSLHSPPARIFKRPPYLIRVLVGLVVMLSAMLASVALAFPPRPVTWLSIKGEGTDGEAHAYYQTIGAPDTYTRDQWLSDYHFDLGDDAHAKYYNAGDLGLGRDMHCRRNEENHVLVNIACYVVNHGFGPGAPPELSADDAISGQNLIATVAMVYDSAKARNGERNPVAFYVFGPDGKLARPAILDSQGLKYVPQLCLPCHGGTYDATAHSVGGTPDSVRAHFLPFDLDAFKYSQQPGFTRADQEEEFRKLNAIVHDTEPTPDIEPIDLIRDLIDKWYESTGGVGMPGSTQKSDVIVPTSYDNANDRGLYIDVVKPYCRTCHVAQNINLADPQFVRQSARNAVFGAYYMPHAEATHHNFWSSSAPSAPVVLANNLADNPGLGRTLQVDRLDDPDPIPEACTSAPDDCSLRGAILAANANPGAEDIITFGVNGTFMLSIPGTSENEAATGDLDIREGLIILGNGADKTIIDGGGIDRVLQILTPTESSPSTNVVIQGVTVRGGHIIFGDYGGGILNDERSTLTLNSSVVRDNAIDSRGGAGIANLIGGTAEINTSTIGPNDAIPPGATGGIGGGIYNEGTLTVANSTISSNKAFNGGGIYNLNLSSSPISTITISNSTVLLNAASSHGGGLYLDGGTTAVQNSIIAGNNSDEGEPDCRGSFTSKGYNLVGNGDGCTIDSGTGDQIGTSGSPIDPQLGPLQNNGGPTMTHAPLPGSPAIDAIPLGPLGSNCAPPSYDQRNAARPQDGNDDGIVVCDMGAVEALPVGNFTLTPDTGTSQVGVPTSFKLTWAVPAPLVWRDLQDVELRLCNDNDIVLWVRLTEGNSSTLSLLDQSGRISGTGTPGENRVLESATAALHLAQSTVAGSGPTGRSVTLTLTASFKRPAAGRIYAIEVLARNDAGRLQGPKPAGRWAVGLFPVYLPLVRR